MNWIYILRTLSDSVIHLLVAIQMFVPHVRELGQYLNERIPVGLVFVGDLNFALPVLGGLFLLSFLLVCG